LPSCISPRNGRLCAELERDGAFRRNARALQLAGYRWNPKKLGTDFGDADERYLAGDRARRRLGLASGAQTLRQAHFQRGPRGGGREYAEKGFPVSERIAHDWQLPNALPLKKCCTEPDPESVKTWYVNGQPPQPGRIFKNADLARTFRLLQAKGGDGFYKGEIAAAIVAKSWALGGTMTLKDLASYKGKWVEPARVQYHGFDVLELPPPAQAWAADEYLNILQVCMPQWAPGETLASLGPTNAKYWHLMVEAKKLAYADLYRYNADPDFVTVPLGKTLVRTVRGVALRQGGSAPCFDAGDPRRISLCPAIPSCFPPPTATAIWLSWVNSNFGLFGSGITVPGLWLRAAYRGALFTLDPQSPNVIEPRKRPFNTLAADS